MKNINMKENKLTESRKDILFVILIIFFISLIGLFNYTIDPYFILKDTVIKGINDVKTHKYSNKRAIIYTDIKLNKKGKDIAFTGNCMLSHYGKGLENVVFFTIPVINVNESLEIIKNIIKIAPNIKVIYFGFFYDDFCNETNNIVTDVLPIVKSKYFNLQDVINLFFSWNTTKYSIETLIDSIKKNGNNSVYIYPYREIAKKNYNNNFEISSLDKIKEIKKIADENNIKLIIYYSPIHVTKKLDLYYKGVWESNQKLKRQLAEVINYYDYSLFNEYNSTPLDENNFNYVDNIHPAAEYNNLIVNDLLKDKKEIGKLLTSQNVDVLLKEDTDNLIEYINHNKKIYDKIKNLKEKDIEIKILRKNKPKI